MALEDSCPAAIGELLCQALLETCDADRSIPVVGKLQARISLIEICEEEKLRSHWLTLSPELRKLRVSQESSCVAVQG